MSAQPGDRDQYVVGKHVYGNLYGVDKGLLSDRALLERLLLEAAVISGAKVVDVKSWDFTGRKKGGVSVVVLVEESHIAIHTWEEYGYATVDVYTCGDHTDPVKGFTHILSVLRPRRFYAHYVVRDSKSERLSFVERLEG